jgi:hypothetical protein
MNAKDSPIRRNPPAGGPEDAHAENHWAGRALIRTALNPDNEGGAI